MDASSRTHFLIGRFFFLTKRETLSIQLTSALNMCLKPGQCTRKPDFQRGRTGEREREKIERGERERMCV